MWIIHHRLLHPLTAVLTFTTTYFPRRMAFFRDIHITEHTQTVDGNGTHTIISIHRATAVVGWISHARCFVVFETCFGDIETARMTGITPKPRNIMPETLTAKKTSTGDQKAPSQRRDCIPHCTEAPLKRLENSSLMKHSKKFKVDKSEFMKKMGRLSLEQKGKKIPND